MPSYYYDQSQGKCLRFIYGGCGGNGNRFETVEDCEKQCDRGKILQNYFYFVTVNFVNLFSDPSHVINFSI